MEETQNRVVVLLNDEQYESLRKESFDTRKSMSEILRDLLIEHQNEQKP